MTAAYLLLWREAVQVREGVQVQTTEGPVDPQGQAQGHPTSDLHLVVTEVQLLDLTALCQELCQRHGTWTCHRGGA